METTFQNQDWVSNFEVQEFHGFVHDPNYVNPETVSREESDKKYLDSIKRVRNKNPSLSSDKRSN